jgi:hypothetical protein
VGNLKFKNWAVQNQEITGAIATGFLGKLPAARWAVPLDIPNCLQIVAQECPSLRRPVILGRSTTTRGLPNCFPWDFARAIPDRTLSLINSLSNSAMEAKIPNTSLPFGVEVSTPSHYAKSIAKRQLIEG